MRAGCGSALLWVLAVASASGADPCAPWPREPDPLPRVSDASPARARWAALRARELDTLAATLRASAPLSASRLWRHARCLAPEGPATAQDLPRAVLRVHEAEVAHGAVAAAGPAAGDLEAALAGLAEPLPLAEPAGLAARAAAVAEPPGPPAAPAPSEAELPAVGAPPPLDPPLPDLGGALAQARRALRGARYEEALAAADAAGGEVAAAGAAEADASVGSLGWRLQRAQLLVVAGTAELALGRAAEARERFARAARIAPELDLDPGEHSPKVVEAWEASRP